MKKIQIIDSDTGDIETTIEPAGGFSIQYAENMDSGKVHILGKIMNGRYGRRHWIKNWVYWPLAEKLFAAHKDKLNPCRVDRILFIEDMEWEQKDPHKKTWVARIKAANNELSETWGYWYVVETRNYFIERMSDNQVAALIYHELRHIGSMGELREHDIEDWSEMVATLGADWNAENSFVPDILAESFTWDELPKHRQQISLVDYTEAQKKNAMGAE